jgi:photosystem II stability/assembly factor-like uncharacterized protein
VRARDGCVQGSRRLLFAAAAISLVITMAGPASASPDRRGWLNTGPSGAEIDDLAVSAADPLRLYAISFEHVYRSDDGGRSWAVTTAPVIDYEPRLAVSAQDPNVVYASGRDLVQKTVDGGHTWTAVMNGLPDPPEVQDLVVDPTDDQVVYAGGTSYDGAVFKTSDGGATWAAADVGFPDHSLVYALAIDPRAPSILFAGAWRDELYKTVDGGGTWVHLSGLPQETPDRIAVDPNDDQRVFTTMDGIVYRSVDGGASWEVSGSGLDGVYAYTLAVSSAEPDTIFTATPLGYPAAPFGHTGLFKSADGGDYWQPTNPEGGADVLVVDPVTAGVLYSTGDGLGVMKSLDGGSHSFQASRGMLETYVQALAVDPTDPAIAYASIGQHWGLFKTTNGGRTWRLTGRGLSQSAISLAVAPSDPRVVYAGVTNYATYDRYVDAGVYRSLDGGGTFSRANIGIGNVKINALAVDPNNSLVVYAAGAYACSECSHGGVWKTDDGGFTWKRLSDGLEKSEFFGIAISQSNPSVLYASAESAGSVYRTLDGGRTWTLHELPYVEINDLAVDPTNPFTVYAVGGPVYRSTDGGQTWTSVTPGGNADIETVEADPSDAGSLCGGDYRHGVTCSSDSGASWAKVPALNGNVPELAIGTKQILYAGTSSHGVAVYRR